MRMNADECMTVARVLLLVTNLEERCGSRYVAEKMNELECDVLTETETDPEVIAQRVFSVYSAEREVLFEEWKEDFNKSMEAHVRQIWSMARNEQCSYEDAFKYVVKMFSDVPEEVKYEEVV